MAVVATLFATGAVPALAQERPYFGVSLGQSKFKSELGACSGWSGILDPGHSCSGDDKGSAWKLYAGYEFNRHIAAEAGYVRLGLQRETASGTISLSPESVRRERDVRALTGALVGSFVITRSFGVTARLGVAYWNERISTSTSSMAGSQTTDGVSPAYGIGLVFGLNRNTCIRFERERFSDVGDKAHSGDVNLVSVGIAHRY